MNLNLDFLQVVEYLPGDKVLIYKVNAEESHIGTPDDPLTTIVVERDEIEPLVDNLRDREG